MIASFPHRNFQLWEYRVSHGSLLVRSPRNASLSTNIDIVLVGVELIMAPRHMQGLEIFEGTLKDRQRAQSLISRDITNRCVLVLLSNQQEYLIVAAAYKLDINEHDIFDSPFSMN